MARADRVGREREYLAKKSQSKCSDFKSCACKLREIALKLSTDLGEKTVLHLSDISDIKELDTIFKTADVSTEKTDTLDLLFECKNQSKSM